MINVKSKNIAITGIIDGLTRNQIIKIIQDLGGTVQLRVKQDTSILIVGSHYRKNSIKNGKSKKLRTAEHYVEKGIPIQIISFDNFFT